MVCSSESPVLLGRHFGRLRQPQPQSAEVLLDLLNPRGRVDALNIAKGTKDTVQVLTAWLVVGLAI